MAELKPLGSEKLNGDDKLKRILELTYFNENKKSTSSSSKPELVKESKTGGVYGIVKEKDGYYVKRGLNEGSLDYIGGMFMKNKNKFSSYAEAFKRLDLLKGQEELQEATKYVLKQNKPQEEMPAPQPSLDAPVADAPVSDTPTDVPSEEPAIDDLPPVEGDGMGDEESKRSDYMSEVQKYAGKLGQELRDLHDKMESDDIKYVLNMIISAVDLDKLDLEDLEDIAEKFEREEDEDGEVPAEEPTDNPETPDEEPSSESDLDETMAKLDSFINTPIQSDEIDLSKYADLEMGEETQDDIQEFDLDEIKNDIHNSISQTLHKYFK